MPKKGNKTKIGVKPADNIPKRILALRSRQGDWYARAKAAMSAVKVNKTQDA